jgi:hypothetical protein
MQKKFLKPIGLILIAIAIFYFSLFLFINIMNADLYARLIETKEQKQTYFGRDKSNKYPILIFIIHRHLQEENVMECSIVIDYKNFKLSSGQNKPLDFRLKVREGTLYNPYGLSKDFHFTDTDRVNSIDCAFETEKFNIPIMVSIGGYPFDNIAIYPLIDLYINDSAFVADYIYKIQKRISGRIFNEKQIKLDNHIESIELTRTRTEIFFVIISSLIFIIMTLIITYGLFTKKKGLSSVDEIIVVAGYILATAGFRDIIGFDRSYGISALEVGVILAPLLAIFIALIYSFRKGFDENGH